jgi:hypothetical protein
METQRYREWTDTAAGVMHARGGGEGTSGSSVVLVHGNGHLEPLHGPDGARTRAPMRPV